MADQSPVGGSFEDLSPIDNESIRTALEGMRKQGILLESDRPIDPDLEFAGVQKKLDGGPPMLFTDVVDYDHLRFATNLFAREEVIDALFDFDGPSDRTESVAQAINEPLEPNVVTQSDAPTQNTVVTEDIDVDDVIAPIRHTEDEPEATTGTGAGIIMGESFDGGSHIGYNRMNFRWGDVGTFQAVPGGHAWMVMKEHYQAEEPIPVTVNFGLPPAVSFVAGAGFDYVVLPKGSDELGLAGAIQGSPVDVVEAQTVEGAYSVAQAEFALEGYLHPRDRRWETAESEETGEQGKHPFHPEWAGYMGRAYKAPTFHVTALTHRGLDTRPILHPMIVHSIDVNNITTTVREGAFYEIADRLQNEVIADVHIPFAMTDWGGVICQVNKRNPLDEGYHRNILTTLMGASRGMRVAIVVDHDIDIYSMDEIIWALTTRVDPEADIWSPVPGGAGQTFQPSNASDQSANKSQTNFEGGLAIDATVPYGETEDAFERPHYPIENIDLADWFNDDQISWATTNRDEWPELLSKSGK